MAPIKARTKVVLARSTVTPSGSEEETGGLGSPNSSSYRILDLSPRFRRGRYSFARDIPGAGVSNFVSGGSLLNCSRPGSTSLPGSAAHSHPIPLSWQLGIWEIG